LNWSNVREVLENPRDNVMMFGRVRCEDLEKKNMVVLYIRLWEPELGKPEFEPELATPEKFEEPIRIEFMLSFELTPLGVWSPKKG
jgi:hypothetical protein